MHKIAIGAYLIMLTYRHLLTITLKYTKLCYSKIIIFGICLSKYIYNHIYLQFTMLMKYYVEEQGKVKKKCHGAVDEPSLEQ